MENEEENKSDGLCLQLSLILSQVMYAIHRNHRNHQRERKEANQHLVKQGHGQKVFNLATSHIIEYHVPLLHCKRTIDLIHGRATRFVQEDASYKSTAATSQ